MATPSNISGVQISELPKEKGWVGKHVFKYQGFWYHEVVLKGLLALHERRFPAETTDILLASYPKSGTTWLKALLISITGGTQNSPLLTANPHELVPPLESHAAGNPENLRQNSSSLLHTHIPYGSLPESIKASGCKIVYVFRDPKDVLVSYWHFAKKVKREGVDSMSLETAFEQFCRGASPYGPYWDHVLGYWKASLEFPQRIFFLRYEELKKEPSYYTKRLSEFLGCPLMDETMIEKVVDLCSFEKLSSLEVNQSGKHMVHGSVGIENNVFFRQGQVGDCKNHLTASMMDEIDEITEQRFKGFSQLIN